jgi:ubiquinone/menaquinone biosynthesis C-methylase UbiE
MIMEEEKYISMAAQLRKPEGEAGIKAGESMNQGNKFQNLQTIEAVNPSPNDKILEIGMGNGLFVKEILAKHPSIRYTGFDHSVIMVNEAKRINSESVAQGSAEFVLGDVSKLPFPEKSFNKILTINTVYFWKDIGATFRELRRVLKPGGTLIVSIRPKHQMENYPFTRYGFTMYSTAELKELLIANRFGIKDVHENREPEYEFNGNLLTMENVIVECYPI